MHDFCQFLSLASLALQVSRDCETNFKSRLARDARPLKNPRCHPFFEIFYPSLPLVTRFTNQADGVTSPFAQIPQSISRNFVYFWKLIYVLLLFDISRVILGDFLFKVLHDLLYIAFILILSAHKIIRSIKQCNALISTIIIYKLSIS